MDEPLDTGTGALHSELFKQATELHDEGDLARRKVLSDPHARDEGERNEHIGGDIERGHQSR